MNISAYGTAARSRRLVIATLFILFTMLITPVAQVLAESPMESNTGTSKHSAANHSMLTQTVPTQSAIDSAPLPFIPNVGQFDPRVHFVLDTPDGRLFFTNKGITFALPVSTDVETSTIGLSTLPESANTASVKAHAHTKMLVAAMGFSGNNSALQIEGDTVLPTTFNYFIGDDQSKWHTDVASYSSIHYQGIYPGIDLHYDSSQGQMKGTYVVAPGADPSQIRWHYDGATNVRINATNGALEVSITIPASPGQPALGRMISEQAPIAWQDINGKRVPVASRFELAPDRSLRFALGSYDTNQPLTLDPTILWSTYLGGSSSGDYNYGAVLDSLGNLYVVGRTDSTDFPGNPFASPAPYDLTQNGLQDAFISKLDKDGRLLFTTYLGGQEVDWAENIALKGSTIAVIGNTASTNFPTSTGGYDRTFNSVNSSYTDVFVTTFNTSGNTLLYGTFMGGNTADVGNDIAFDSSGNIGVVGSSSSTSGFPTTANAYLATPPASNNAFVAKITPTLAGPSSLSYSTFLTGNGWDDGNGIAIDSSGNFYIIGTTGSTDIPRVSAYDATSNGANDVFVVRINPNATSMFSLLYGTYIGGSSNDYGYDIALGSGNTIYITGATSSSNFPAKNAAQPKDSNPTTDVFVTAIAGDGQSLVFSTFLGGSGSDYSYAIALDSAGKIYVTGITNSGTFPQKDSLHGLRVAGSNDGFVSVMTWDAAVLKISYVYSSYLGGTASDYPQDIGVDAAGNAYVVGFTFSDDYFLILAADSSFGGGGEGFVTKLSPALEPLPVVFIPGILGSYLVDGKGTATTADDTQYWPGLAQDHTKLSLFSSDTQYPNIIATDVIRSDPIGRPVYGPLIESLLTASYREYAVNSIVARRTTAGCDTTAQARFRPNLFVLAYDWRKDNATSAAALKDYIGCIRKFYPGKQVNIVTHSMGGLVARRYILDDTSNTVKGLISIAAPWLGAPKAINVLQTGQGMVDWYVVLPSTLKYIAGSFISAHQLLPSQAYYDLAGSFMFEAGWNFDNDATASETYTYSNFVSAMDLRYGYSATNVHQFTPGTAAKNFHAYSTARGKQDDWRVDTTGVKYYQIFGKQLTGATLTARETIVAITATGTTFSLQIGDGDGTVPLVSASRRGALDYNPAGMNCQAALAGTDTILDRCHMVQREMADLHAKIVTIDETLQKVLLYLTDANK